MSSSNWKNYKNVSKAVKKKTSKKKVESKAKEEAPKLSAKEAFRGFVYETLKNVFSLSYQDGNINVNIDNVFPLMKALELDTKDEAVIDMIHEACIENFGNIDINEFDQTIMGQRRRVTGEEFEEDLRSAFSLIDVDADGVISVQDLYQLMMGIGEMLTDDELSELLKMADNDGDGQVNYKDFKFFLTGELIQEIPQDADASDEEEEIEPEPETKEEANDAKQEDQNVNPPEEVVKTEPEKQLTEEEQKANAERELRKHKSLLWAFSSQNFAKLPEKPKITEEKIVPELKGDSSETDNKSDGDCDNLSSADDTKHVTAVTVSYLDSIKEEVDANNKTSQKKEISANNQMEPENVALRRQSFSKMASVDSGIDATDAEEIQKHSHEQSDSVADEGFFSRTHSAKSRFTYDRSHVSSAKSTFTSRPSTAGSRFEKDIEESVQDEENIRPTSRLSERRSSKSSTGDIRNNETFEGPVVIEDDAFKSPLTKRQIDFLQNSEQQQTYCEIGVSRETKFEMDEISNDDTLDLESVMEYDPTTISPRVNLTRLKSKHSNAVPVLQRSRSATRLRTFKKIENAILTRQNTDPRLNIEHIKAANERSAREHREKLTQEKKPNSNGLFCTHISIDLSVNEKELKPKVSAQQTSLRKLLQRPQTAMTFKEAEKLNIVYGKNYDTSTSKSKFNGNMKVIDLSNNLNIDTNSVEIPGLTYHHHGYKSVLPLGRVLSGNKSKINKGNGIILNSISRKLERIQYLAHISKCRKECSQNYSTNCKNSVNISQRQSIINLEIPDLMSQRQQSYRKCSHYSKFISKSLIRT